MATSLGKRKRISREQLEQPSRSPSPSSGSESEDSGKEDLQDAFRRAFEAKFKPLNLEPKKKEKVEVIVEDEDEPEDDSDWSGMSSDAKDEVEIFDYATTQVISERASKAEKRAFMSSKPPTLSTQNAPNPPPKRSKDPADLTETAHLKNDLALQRLLRDSHILSSTSTSTSGTSTPTISATGSARHKSTDLHLLSLGAKTSLQKQKNMPMSHRKGITAMATHRENVRRKDARDNGIVLEKEKRAKKFGGERERGIGGPDVGTFKGGMLKLSKKDVADITSGGHRGGIGGRGGRGGRGGKGRGGGKRGKR
ncbi:hypothetical protein B0J11DRAFT_340450 [Dendryphion nanum]|uniref:Uncharacterized protein n=1 Tax=Dendryphion nanum TaxID=256645 RepID=A0A9P9DPX8_9PLEO|nr:hypothetical protein B0J11DRAFT_340450 [Dendryphion nanum]